MFVVELEIRWDIGKEQSVGQSTSSGVHRASVLDNSLINIMCKQWLTVIGEVKR